MIINPKQTYFFPSVIPMNNYTSYDISVTKEDGSYGGSFEEGSYDVKSLNKSGAVIEIGDKPKVIVEGTLFCGGEPLEGTTGMLISDFKEDGKNLKYRFFYR